MKTRSSGSAPRPHLFERAEISRVLRHRVEGLPLDFAERLCRLPNPLARSPNHRILGLPMSGRQRHGRRVVLDDGVQVLIEHAFEASSVTIGAESVRDQKASPQDQKEGTSHGAFCLRRRT